MLIKRFFGTTAAVLLFTLGLPAAAYAANGPTLVSQCQNKNWKNFSNPTFTSLNKCVEYAKHNNSRARGNIKYTAYGLGRHAKFHMNSATGKGVFKYSDDNGQNYTVDISDFSIQGNTAWFSGQVTAGDFTDNWLFAKVQDNHNPNQPSNNPDQIWGSFVADQATAENGVTTHSDPGDGPFNVTHGNIKVIDATQVED